MVVALVGFLMVIFGAVGIFYSAFLFVFGRRPRARKTFIWSSATVVFGVVVFVVAASIWMPEEEKQAAVQVEQVVPREEQAATKEEEDSKELQKNETVVASKVANADEKIPAPPTIPGLKWVDITLNLEKEPYNFKFSLRKNRLTPTVEREAKEIDHRTGAQILVRIQSYGDDVVLYEASVSGDTAKRTASWLIPYMATAPFDGNPQAESREWAISAIEKIESQKPVYHQVGDVLMELSGNPPYFYVLQVNHKNLEKYLSEVLR